MTQAKHTAVIYGKRVRKIYRAYATSIGWGSRNMHDEPKEDTVFIEITKIGEYQLSNPPIEKSTMIFLHELNASTKVESVQRSTEDKWVCKTEHIVEIVEDEETQRTYEKALEYIEQYNEAKKPEPRSEPNDNVITDADLKKEPRSEPKEYEPKKRWWKFWTW